MAINILQELNLGAAKASFSRDEVETLADIKKLNIAQKYPNNYDIFCKEDGCKYRLNKTSHSTMQDNLPHPTGKWRRVDSVISSSMPAPITIGDVILYLGPTVVDRTDPLNPVVKYQTGKYYRTEYTKATKQMYAFVQNTAPDVPDTSPNPAVIWFSETSTLSEGSVLFAPVNGSIFDNKEHGIIMTSNWDGQSAISGSSYEYLDNSDGAKLGMVRNSDFDTTFDSYPELTWNMFDTEAELENIKQNVIPEAISSTVDANLGQAKKLNDILTDGDIKLLKQGGIEKLVSSKPDATVSDSTIGFVQCDCNRNEETGEVTLNITNVKYGPFTSEEIAENVFVDEGNIIIPSGMQFPAYAITCSVTNKAKDAIFSALKDSNLYKGTLSFDAMSFISRLEGGAPLVIGFAAAAPYKDDEHTGSVDSRTYVSMYNLLELIDSQSPVNFTPIPVSEIPDIKNRTVELLEKETVLDLILYVMCPEGLESQLTSSNVLELLNEQFVIGTEASGILNEFPTMRKEIEDSIAEEFNNVKKLNDVLNEEDVDTIISRPRESLFDVKDPYIPYGNKLLTECTFVKLEFDEDGVATITDSATVSDAMALDKPSEWTDRGKFAILFGITQNGATAHWLPTKLCDNCAFKVDYDNPDVDINRKPENMFGIDSVYFAIGNNGYGGNVTADYTACKFTNIDTYAPGTEDVDGRHLLGDLIGDYEDDGTPIISRNYNKSDFMVLYGIALVTMSGNVISEADYTAKNMTASINKRVVPAYQESGLLVDFPKVQEQVASAKQTADSAIELALPEKTKDYIKNKLYDIKTAELHRATASESQGTAYDNTNCNGLISIGSSYDHQDDSRSISVTFKNYFDSSKSDYVSASEVIAIKDAAQWNQKTNYIAIPVTIKGYGGRTKESILESLKGVIASKSSSSYTIKRKTSYGARPYGLLVDVYGGLTSDQYGAAHLNLLSFASLSRANESTFSVAELLSDAVEGGSYYQTPCLILVYDVYYGDSPEISPDIITELDTEDLVKNTFDIYTIPMETRLNRSQEAIENMSSVTGDISALETKVAKSNKLADRFTDAEMDKLFKKISEKIISSVNGVNDVDFRICACTSSDNWATATITKYMEAPLSGDLTDYHIALPGAYGNTFDTIAVSCGISFTNGTSATGMPAYEVMSNKSIDTWLNAYLLNPVAIYTAQTFSSSSFDKSTYYRTRVKDGGPYNATIKYSDMEPLKSNAYESPSRIHFLVFIQVNNNTTAEDLNAADLFELAKKAIVPVGVTSGMLTEFDSVKENASSAVTDIESLSATVDTRIPSKTSDFIKENIFEDKTPVHMIASYSETYHGPGTYDNTNNNGLISIGSTYDHTDANRSISPVFKNYFDPNSASADYVEASEVLAIKESEVWSNKASYIAIPVYIGSATTKALLAESLTGIIGSFNPSYNYKMTLNGRAVNTYGTLVDIYAGIGSSDKIDSIGNVKSWTRLTENSFSASELVTSLPDIVYGTYRRLTLVLVYNVYYGDYPVFDSADIIRIDSDTLIANTLNIAKNSLDERLSDIEEATGDVSDLEERTSAIETKLEPLTDDVSALSDATKSIIQKYPIKLATFYDAKFNGALKINADTYDPETTTSVSLSFYNYYDSSKDDYRNPANPATPMLVEDKFVAVAAYIDIPEVLGIPPYSSAAQLKEHCKNISVRFDRNQSIKVDLQNNNNTSIYSGANIFIRDIYFKANSITQAPALANYTYSTKITNSNPIDELVDASYSPGFIPNFIFILEVIPDDNYDVPLKNYLAQQNFAKFINSLCEISFNKVRDAEDAANEAKDAIKDIDIEAIAETSAKVSRFDVITDETIAKIGTTKTVSEGASFEYRYYEPDPEHPEDLLVPVSAKTKEQQIEEKEITIGFGAEFEEQTDSNETETITVYGGYLSGTAGKSQIDLVAKTKPIIDADESEESASTLNGMLYTSSEGIKCVTVPLQLVHANGNFLIDATNMDELLEFKITSEFGDHECGNINFSLEDVFIGISLGDTEPEDSSRSLEESQLFTIKNSSSSFTFIRVGKRDHGANSESLNNTVTADLSELQYLGGFVEALKPYIQYMEGRSFNIIILAGIHVETERDTVFPLKDFVDAGEDIIDALNESISFYKLKGDIITSFENDIEDIKDDLSVVSDLSKNFEGDKKTLWDSISTGSLTAYDFNARSNLKNMASANHKYRVGLIAPNWMESWNYNAFVNIGSSYTVGDNRIYPQYMNYFNEEEASTYGEFHDIKDVFVNVEGYSAYMLHTGLYLQSDLFYDSGDYYIGGSMTNQFDLLEAMMYSMPHIDFSKYTEGDSSRKYIYQTDEAKTKILCDVLVEDVYIAAITSTDPSDVSKFVWKKYTGPQSIIDCFEQYLGVNSKMDSVGQVRLGIIVSLRCRTNKISSSEIEECLETFRTANTQEFAARNLSFSDNRISKAIDAYNMAKTAKDTPDLMYYPSIVACRTRITGGTIASEGIDFGSLYTPRIVSPIVDNEDGTYTLKYWNNASSEAFDQTKVADIINSGTMWYTAGFFGENLSVALDSLSVSDDILSNFVNAFTGLAWYDADTYMKSLDTALKPKYTMRNIEPRLDNESIKNRDNIDISELFLNIDTRLVKEIYVAVVSEGNNMGYPSLGTYYTTSVESGGDHEYVIERLETIPVFRKLEINTVNDIYTISMQRIVDLCGRPGFSNNVGETNKGAHILFTIKVDTSAIPFFKTPELVTYLFGNDTVASLYDTSANSTSEVGNDSSITGNRLQIFNALFNNIKRYPSRCPGLWHAVYITGSVDQSIRETKNVVFDNIKNKTSKIAKYCSSDNDLNYLETGGIGYRARKDTEDNSKYLADVYMKTEDGSVIKIAEGRQITTPSPELIRILSNT